MTIAGEGNQDRGSEASVPSAGDTAGLRRKGQPTQRRRTNITAPKPEDWSPPDFGDERRTRIGASVVEQFVAGHDASDVLRELVQNEFDGGGDRLVITFGENSLDVLGNGRGISSDGWKRLSVIIGTGRVVGADDKERVLPKANGIGSKNFGLRSLFLFGDQIYVRSGGHVAILDLPTLETGRIRDAAWWGGTGVRLKVPHRAQSFEKLEPFTVEEEQRILETMASGMLATLVKLALAGRRPGLRELVLRSIRNGRTLGWKQGVRVVRCRMRSVSALRRKGRLTDARDGEAGDGRSFEELEFVRAVALPAEYSGTSCPNYYRQARDMIKIGVSLPIARNRIDLTKSGNFYYPLQTPDSRTGCAVSVSAPFDLDSERSSLLDNGWNRWLIDQAVSLTVDLLKEDWFHRFGADAYKALIQSGPATPGQFADAVAEHLAVGDYWPTRATSRAEKYAKASTLVLPDDPLLDGFLADSRYLDLGLQADADVRELATVSGAKRFTVSSLIWLRCAGDNVKNLETKIGTGEAEYRYASYVDALSSPERQAKMAAALTAVASHMSKANRADLRSSFSTLTADGELRPAKDLVLVDQAIWQVCPEPMSNRLHPDIVPHRAIASLCQKFDEQNWIVSAAARAIDGQIDEAEREALYAKLLTPGIRIGRRALIAVRNSPITRNHRGEWVLPSSLVMLKGASGKLMSPVVSAPSRELTARPELLRQLRIRDRLNQDDILTYATLIAERPETAQRFESLLDNNQRLLTPALVEQLRDVSFLRARSGNLASPGTLHLDTLANRLAIQDDERIVGGANNALYRRLQIREHPTVETLLDVLGASRARLAAPSHPEVLYRALVAAVAGDRGARSNLANEPILWVGADYHAPNEVLVGTQIPKLFEGAVPTLRGASVLSQAYLALGASAQPRDQHWVRFFEHVSGTLDNEEAVSTRDRRRIMEAYRQRGTAGLPANLDEDTRCLLDRGGRLFSLSDLRSGLLVEGDYPALADALTAADSAIGITDVSDGSRAFFSSLNIRPLTSIAGAGVAVFGEPTPPPLWFKARHSELILQMLSRPLFAKALHELAQRQRHTVVGFRPLELAELRRGMEGLSEINFFDAIFRRYSVHGEVAQVSVEVAVLKGVIGLLEPRTKLDFQQLIAQSLAEIAGARDVGQARALSTVFLPLVLSRTPEDMRVYLERMGIAMRSWSGDVDDEIDFDEGVTEDVREEIVRQVIEELDTDSRDLEDAPKTVASPPQNPTQPPSTVPPPAPPPFVLPDLQGVTMSIAPTTAQEIQRGGAQGGLSGGSSGGWAPRGPAEIERDQKVGQRGEALVYRMELERIRALGHGNPEELVIWTSQTDLGADHDIKSVGEDGRIRWIEVKSTTGTDGRFEWSRKEFEKALREGGRYELWRVYLAATSSPVAKCFPNPAKLLGVSRLVLDLGSLRARIEDLD